MNSQPPYPRVMDRLRTPILTGALLLASCGKSTTELSLATVGDTMTYDTASLTVKTGQKVHLVLRNNATTATMKHNWVLVRPGKEAAVATAGQAAGESAGYIELGPDVLAVTPL